MAGKSVRKSRCNHRGAARPSADFNADIRVGFLAIAEVMPQRPVSHDVQHGGGAQAQQGHEQESGLRTIGSMGKFSPIVA